MSDIKINEITDKYFQLLQKKGYLQSDLRTLQDFKLVLPKFSLVRLAYDITHPLLIIGKCLPIDFQKNIVDPVLFEHTPEQKNIWYETNKHLIKGPRMWGSLMGDVYRHLISVLTVQINVYQYSFNRISFVVLSRLPKDIHLLISEYLVGPVNILVEFIQIMKGQVVETFPGHPNMASAEDQLMLNMTNIDINPYMRYVTDMYLESSIFASLSQQEKELIVMNHFQKKETYPYSHKFVDELPILYFRIRDACSVCHHISICS